MCLLQRLFTRAPLEMPEGTIWPTGGLLPPSPGSIASFLAPFGLILTGTRAFSPSTGPTRRAYRGVLPLGHSC